MRFAERVERGVEVVLVEFFLLLFFEGEELDEGGELNESGPAAAARRKVLMGNLFSSLLFFSFSPSLSLSPHLRDQVASVVEHLEAGAAHAEGSRSGVHFAKERRRLEMKREKEKAFCCCSLQQSLSRSFSRS